MILELSAMAFRPGILSFRATVTPRLPGSVTLFRWSHGFSIAVEPMSSRKKVHLLLPTGSCEHLRKHSNHPLLPHMCQFIFTKFYGNVGVSNFAQTSPWIGHYRYKLVPVKSTVQWSVARAGLWPFSSPLAGQKRLPIPPRRAFSVVRCLSANFSYSREDGRVNYLNRQHTGK